MSSPWHALPLRLRELLVRFTWLAMLLVSPPFLMRFVSPAFFLVFLFWWNIGGLVVNPIAYACGYDLFKYEEFGIITKSKADETLTLVLVCSFWVLIAFCIALLVSVFSGSKQESSRVAVVQRRPGPRSS
jgi:hypothetical protein